MVTGVGEAGEAALTERPTPFTTGFAHTQGAPAGQTVLPALCLKGSDPSPHPPFP